MTRNHARLLAVAGLVLPVTALPVLGAHADTVVTSVQAETFSLGSTLGAVRSDATAQGGRSLLIWSNGTASRTVDVTRAATAVQLRVRADLCSGAPQLRVSVDGRALPTTTVTTTAWSTVRLPASVAAGRRTVRLSFLNDYRTRQCDRNVHVDAVSFTAATVAAPPPADSPTTSTPTTPTPTPATTPTPTPTTAPVTGRVVFDADVATRGLTAYSGFQNANRISIVDDPVLGAARKVMRFTVYDTDDQLTGNPRAQVETSKFWNSGDEYYVGESFYFPHDWPMQQDTRQWVNLGEVYGPPYAGASPNALFVKRVASGGQVIAWQRNGTYGWDRPFEVPLVKGRWHDFVFRIKLSSDPAVGFWEAWSNTGSGWQRLKLHGQDRLYARTVDASNNGGANYHKLAHYRSKGMWPVATHYAADHKIGTSFDAVAPRSHP